MQEIADALKDLPPDTLAKAQGGGVKERTKDLNAMVCLVDKKCRHFLGGVVFDVFVCFCWLVILFCFFGVCFADFLFVFVGLLVS